MYNFNELENNDELTELLREHGEIQECFNIMHNLVNTQGENIKIISRKAEDSKEKVVDGIQEEYEAKTKKYKNKIKYTLTYTGIGIGVVGTAAAAVTFPVGISSLAVIGIGLTGFSAITGRKIGSYLAENEKRAIREKIEDYRDNSRIQPKYYEGEILPEDILCPHSGIKVCNALLEQIRTLDSIEKDTDFIKSSAISGYVARINDDEHIEVENLNLTEYNTNTNTLEELSENVKNDKKIAIFIEKTLDEDKRRIEDLSENIKDTENFLRKRERKLKKI